jgi:hypothetical protein
MDVEKSDGKKKVTVDAEKSDGVACVRLSVTIGRREK